MKARIQELQCWVIEYCGQIPAVLDCIFVETNLAAARLDFLRALIIIIYKIVARDEQQGAGQCLIRS